MKLQIVLRSAINHQPQHIEVDVPDLLSNDYGSVVMCSGTTTNSGYPSVVITKVDDALVAAGVRSITGVGHIQSSDRGDYVSCGTHVGERGILLASRPWLRDLVANRDAIASATNDARDAYWQNERAGYRQAVEQPLLDQMHTRAAELRAKIPAGAIEVAIKQDGDVDGDPILSYSANGIALQWTDVTIVGGASAVRPGALGAFASVRIGYTTPEQITAREAALRATAEKKATAAAELVSTPIPAGALADYNRYRGDAERAWEVGDESAWAAINHWAPFIEVQGHGSIEAAIRQAKQASREQPVDH